MKRRILITVEYNGSRYCGWQIQKGQTSVQGVLTNALEKVCRHKLQLAGSGRTDAGVHAMAQCAHFDCLNDSIPDDKFPQCVNALLPHDIRVVKSRRVCDDFHARFDAKSKTYIYKMYIAAATSPLRHELYAYIPYNLNTAVMEKASKCFLGKHNFEAFCASGSDVKDFIREIYSINISRKKEGEYTEIFLEICGSGFLRNMVRIIAGTLIDVARGKIEQNALPDIIENKKRELCGFTAPACGLYLKNVEY